MNDWTLGQWAAALWCLVGVVTVVGLSGSRWQLAALLFLVGPLYWQVYWKIKPQLAEDAHGS